MSDEHEQDLVFEWSPCGGGQVTLKIQPPKGDPFVQKFDATKLAARKRVLDEIQERFPAADPESVRRELELIAGNVADLARADSGGDSDADQLVALVDLDTVELFREPGEYDSSGFASIEIGGHRETWPIGSNGFKRWLVHEFYQRHKKAVSSQAISDAVGLISARARFDGPEMPVYLRMAEHEGAAYIDIGGPDWDAIRVTARGWTIVSSMVLPVRFRRRTGMLPLPIPQKGGTVDELRPLLNLASDEAWVLFVSCLVSYLLPCGPYPILAIHGEAGSGKSSLTRYAKRLTDPNKAPLRRLPGSDRDLMIAASNTWVLAFDNLSSIRGWLSDALCTLSTGGATAPGGCTRTTTRSSSTCAAV